MWPCFSEQGFCFCAPGKGTLTINEPSGSLGFGDAFTAFLREDLTHFVREDNQGRELRLLI